MSFVNRLVAMSGVVWLWLMVEFPRVALACSVCTAGRDEENQLAFLLSTIFMSVLPLLAIGTLVGVLWRRIKKLEAETARQNAAAAGPPTVGT